MEKNISVHFPLNNKASSFDIGGGGGRGGTEN